MFNATMDFGLGEDIDALRETVRKFALEEIAPKSADVDRSNDFPMELWEMMGNLGLHGITISEEFGGVDMGYLAHCVAVEEISRANAAIGMSYGAHSNLCINQIYRWGNEQQKNKYLPKLKANGLLRMVTTKVWNKEGVSRLGHLFEYEDDKSFQKCQPIFQEIERNEKEDQLIKVFGNRGVVLEEYDFRND